MMILWQADVSFFFIVPNLSPREEPTNRDRSRNDKDTLSTAAGGEGPHAGSHADV